MIEIDPNKLKPFDMVTFIRVVTSAPDPIAEPEARMNGWWYTEIEDLDDNLPFLKVAAVSRGVNAVADGFVATLGCTREEARRFAQWCAQQR